MATLGAKHRYEVTGIATFGGLNSLGGATIAIWDLPTAQTLLRQTRPLRRHLDRRQRRHLASRSRSAPCQPLVPASLQVKDSEAQAAADAKDTNVIVKAIRYFLLGFGGIALFVGAFVIFNTLSITVAQRTREFATLRTLGASRRQVMRSVVIEGVVIGLLASVVGLFAGFGLAKLLTAIGGELPEGRDGVRAADRPRLARAGYRDHVAGEHHAGPAGHAGAADRRGPRGLDAAALALRRPLAEHGRRRDRGVRGRHLRRHLRQRAGRAGGRPAARPRDPGRCSSAWRSRPRTWSSRSPGLVGLPARRSGGVAGELANSNSVRNPSRTASTAAALMIGLTLVTVVAVLGAGLRSTVESAVTDQVSAPYIVDGNDGVPFAAAEGDALARVPGVKPPPTSASTRRSSPARRRTSPASTRRRSRASTTSTGPMAPPPHSPNSAPTARW